jgi:outer membrane protein TolC
MLRLRFKCHLRQITAVLFGLFLCFPGYLWADTLLEAVDQALQNDPLLKVAGAQRNASLEIRSQAWAGWMPQISSQASFYKSNTRQSSVDTKGAVDYNYNSDAKGISFKQALFNPRLWFNLKQSGAMVDMAEATYEIARNDAINRVVSVYAEKLRLEKGIEAAKIDAASLESRFHQQLGMQKIGQASLVDVAQAEANLLQAGANMAQQSAQLQATNLELARITGSQWDSPLNNQDYRRVAAALTEAVDQAIKVTEEPLIELHPQVVVKQKNLDAATLEIRKSQSDHSPTASLVASWQEGTSQYDTNIGQKTTTMTVGVQLLFPIFSGGSVLSSNREKYALKEKAEYDLLQTRSMLQGERKRTLALLKAYLPALKAGLESDKAAELQLKQAVLGIEAGIRSQVDLDAAKANKAKVLAELFRSVAASLTLFTQYQIALGVSMDGRLADISKAVSGR